MPPLVAAWPRAFTSTASRRAGRARLRRADHRRNISRCTCRLADDCTEVLWSSAELLWPRGARCLRHAALSRGADVAGKRCIAAVGIGLLIVVIELPVERWLERLRRVVSLRLEAPSQVLIRQDASRRPRPRFEAAVARRAGAGFDSSMLRFVCRVCLRRRLPHEAAAVVAAPSGGAFWRSLPPVLTPPSIVAAGGGTRIAEAAYCSTVSAASSVLVAP